eukprot:TRINITY_DN602_c0_g1_i1.p2 TRINITY_DN602_c0_g1~~TRINITY_DN602_c0_g1_i1.p2  ORF type:complete len:117 (-),score=20.78 TRINITY_DN602_c0_g1_i1:56-406(-)
MGRTLVANLPPMTAADKKRFEEEVPIWGEQRRIRRQQLQVVGASSVVGAGVVPAYAMFARGNTILVGAGAAIVGLFAGMAVGHVVGTNIYPSIASNSETTMVKRLWWARECVKALE